MKTRRAFLLSMAGIPALNICQTAFKEGSKIMTVNGWIDESGLGYTLMHEHVLVDFIGADKVNKERYDEAEVFKRALPKLLDAKAAGCSAFVDCTPAYLGRNVALLKKLSAASGLAMITNTGFYGASNEKYYPRAIYDLSAQAIAKLWIEEFHLGIDGTTVRPGYIKLGVDQAPLSEVQRKTIQAAAITHLETGLTIGIHTGNGEAAKEELAILEKNGVAADAMVWIHAQNENNFSYFSDLGSKGVWVEFDNVSVASLSENLKFLQHMKSQRLLHRTLISHDSGWYNVGEKNGGRFNGYTAVFKQFVPYLISHGFSQNDVDMLLKHNPRRALGVNIRKYNQ